MDGRYGDRPRVVALVLILSALFGVPLFGTPSVCKAPKHSAKNGQEF